MKVSEETPFIDIAIFHDFVDAESVKELKQRAEEKIGDCYALTFREFFACAKGDFSSRGIDFKDTEHLTVLQYYWVERFKDFASELADALERLQAPQSLVAQRAAKSCLQLSFEEAVLTFCQEYFNLQSFNAAYEITIAEYLIAKKNAYNKAVFEHAMHKIQEQKIK